MPSKLPSKYRRIAFAILMSASTALIVSAIILYLHGVGSRQFLGTWLRAFATAWPVVFLSILVIAPRIDRMLNRFFEPRA